MIWKWQIYENIIVIYYYCTNYNYNTFLPKKIVYGFICYSMFNILQAMFMRFIHEKNVIMF
jgi:hypothetical protein